MFGTVCIFCADGEVSVCVIEVHTINAGNKGLKYSLAIIFSFSYKIFESLVKRIN